MRAVAVSLVCVSHLIGGPSASIDLGTVGVHAFFVLSGFLITTLLLNEWDEHGTINLPRFYFRRALRIFPAYYAYLAVIALVASLGVIQLNRGDLFHGLTYTVNYVMPSSSVFVQHAWSLAVEEQFYLLWPVLLLVLGRKRGLQFALIYICLAPLVRIGVHESLPDAMKGTIRYRFETVADAIAIGCVLAGYRAQIWTVGWYRRIVTSAWIWLAPVGIVAIALTHSKLFQGIIGITVMNLLIATIVDRVMRVPADAVGRVLNTRAFTATGVLSYSIYLWQQPFLASHHVASWTGAAMGILFTILAALASYFAIERPFLAFRQHLERGYRWRVASVLPWETSPPE